MAAGAPVLVEGPMRAPGSALPLLVAQVVADHHDPPVPADHLALVADLLHARLDLHDFSWAPRTPGRLFVAVDDATPGEVVGAELDDDAVAGQDPDVVHPQLAADVRENLVPVGELDPEHRVRERLDDGALDLDGPFLFRHVLRVPLWGWSGVRARASRSERTRTDGKVYGTPDGAGTAPGSVTIRGRRSGRRARRGRAAPRTRRCAPGCTPRRVRHRPRRRPAPRWGRRPGP